MSSDQDLDAAIAAAQEAAKADAPVTGGGIAKTVTSALREIPEGLVKAGSGLYQWERDKAAKLAEYLGADPATVEQIRNFGGEQWQPEQVEAASDLGVNAVLPEFAEKPVQEWTQHAPQNETEQNVATVSSFLPALATKNPAGLTGGQALIRKLVTRVLAPAAVTEKAGDVAHEVAPEYEGAVRFIVGAIASPQVLKSAAARNAAKSISGNRAALDAMRRMIIADYGDTPAGMQRAQAALVELGIPEGATLMDIGPNLKQGGAQIYSKPGVGRETIYEKLKGRDEGTADRSEALIRENVGPKVDEGLEIEALKQRKQAGAEMQRESHAQQAAPADLEPVVTKIDTLLGTEKSPKLRRTLETVRRMLHVGKTDPSQPDVTETASASVLSARQAISEMLYEADGSPKAGLGPKEQRTLQDLYADLNTALDPANPTLRVADKSIEAAAKQEEAFQTGKQDVLKTDPDTAISPEAFDRTWTAMDMADKRFLLKGLTAKIDAMKGTTANDRAALKRIILGEGKWNHQKIASIIGEEAAGNLVRGLTREQVFQDTAKGVLHNSKTAETQIADKQPAAIEMAKDVVDRAAVGGAVAGMQGAGVGLATAPIKAMLNKYGDKLTARQREEIGKMLASSQPHEVVAALQKIQDSPGGGMSKMLMMALMARKQEQKREEEVR